MEGFNKVPASQFVQYVKPQDKLKKLNILKCEILRLDLWGLAACLFL